MFTPLKLGTNHMLGVDNFVPLTVNWLAVPSYREVCRITEWIAGKS